jgi:hypothetical protein
VACAYQGFEGQLEQTRKSVRALINARQEKKRNKTTLHMRTGRKPPAREGVTSSGKRTTKFRRDRTCVHDEHRLHQSFIKNPQLLYTPRLYAGGLFLDAVISKRQLSSEHIPDFLYITCQANVIKVTLVEIESSARRVFVNIQGRERLHSDVNGPLHQVKSWQKVLSSSAERKASLLKLKRLFDCYPLRVFDAEGLSDQIILQFDYVLIIGNEEPKSASQLELIEDVQREHGILFMTYPMMLQAARETRTQRNLLRLTQEGVIADSLQAGAALVHKVPTLTSKSPQTRVQIANLRQLPDPDPYGMNMIGVGTLFLSKSRRDAYYDLPNVRHRIFQRAEGRCELPGCGLSICGGDGNVGSYMLRNVPGIQGINDQIIVLLCSSHVCEHDFEEKIQGWDAFCRSSNRLVAYGSAYESQWQLLERTYIDRSIDRLCVALGVSQSDDKEYFRLRDWLLRLRSAAHHSFALRKILAVGLDLPCRPVPLVEGEGGLEEYPVLQELYRLGFVTLVAHREGIFRLEPLFPYEGFVAYLVNRYGEYLSRAIYSLVTLNAEELRSYADQVAIH